MPSIRKNLVAGVLRKDGHVVYSIAEESPSIADVKVLAAANRRKSILLTADKDFGELVFRLNKAHEGVVLIRLAGNPPSEKADIVADVVSAYNKKLHRAFTVVTNTSIRIRLS